MSEKQSTSSVSIEEKGEHIEVLDAPFVKSAAEKRFVKKMNLRLLPLAGFIIFLQFVDKMALSVAVLIGILQDTNMTLNQYSWLSALFYLGYLVFQLPNNYFLQRFPIGKYMGTIVFCWGVVTICTAFCKNFAQLAGLRVLLGLFEAATYPTLFLIFNTLYRRSEQSACFGFLYLCNGLAGIIGTALGPSIAKIGDKHGIKAWQWGYIIWGAITIFAGILAFFFLVDSPESKILQLTEEEKEIVKERTRDNAVVRKQAVQVSQYWEALKEPRLWLIFATSLTHNLQNGGLLAYGTILITGLGFNAYDAIYLSMPGGVLTVIYIAIAVIIHRRNHQMIYTAVLCYIVSAIGCILLAVLPNSGVRLLGLYLCWAQTGAYVMLLSIIGSTVNGYSKKIFYSGANMIAYTIGNFCGPLMLVEHTGPEYRPTMWGLFGSNIFDILCLLLIRYLLVRTNKKRESLRSNEPTDVTLNLTDKEDKNYVYSL